MLLVLPLLLAYPPPTDFSWLYAFEHFITQCIISFGSLAFSYPTCAPTRFSLTLHIPLPSPLPPSLITTFSPAHSPTRPPPYHPWYELPHNICRRSQNHRIPILAWVAPTYRLGGL